MFKRYLHGAAILKSRRFLKLSGLDAPKFLQGLTTNDIQKLNTSLSSGQYSALLNAQGRMMYDIFIYRTRDDYFIECDGQIQERVFLHLQTYNLRTKTEIKMVEGPVIVFSSVPLEGAAAVAKDTRSNWNFTRYFYNSSLEMEDAIANASPRFTEGRYNRERILKGIPEGAFEIASRQTVPLEFNIDLMGGIDFNKGCYLGQELVTRTHHRGVVRKRVLPLRFHALDPETVKPLRSDPFECDTMSPLTKNLDKQNEFLPTAIESSGKLRILSRTDSVGKHIFSQGNIGIGMMRLDVLKDAQNRKNLATLDHIENDWILADALIPDWWPESIFDNMS